MLKKGKKGRRDDSSEFDDKEKKRRKEPERVDKLTRKLLQLLICSFYHCVNKYYSNTIPPQIF